MKCSLYQAYASRAAFIRPIDHRLHQHSSDAEVLRIGIDSDGADAGNDGAFVKCIAPHDTALDFRHDAVETRMGEHLRNNADGHFRPGKVARKVVCGVDRGKGPVADLTADENVLRQCRTYDHARWRFRGHTLDPPLCAREYSRRANSFEDHAAVAVL